MRIENVRILTPDGVFRQGMVDFEETIRNVHFEDDVCADGLSLLVAGLVEIHAHGALGYDFSKGDAEELRMLSEYQAKNGITSFLATTMSFPENTLERAVCSIRDFENENGARCLGLNLEGPFLAESKRGAHRKEYLKNPDIEMFKRLNETSGDKIRIISIAPELPGAMDFISEASKYCVVSVAHTAADYECALKAFEAGATHVTHLFNAMNPLLHRAPGVIGAANDAGANVELIPDGLHIHPAVVRMMFDVFCERICLISDSIASAGLPDGTYQSGGLPVFMSDGNATLEDGTIAGSAITLFEGVRRAINFGIRPEDAFMSATYVNAHAIGAADKVGTIKPGNKADFILLDQNYNIRRVLVGGKDIL